MCFVLGVFVPCVSWHVWWYFDDDKLLCASLACPYWPVSDAVSKLGSVGPFGCFLY